MKPENITIIDVFIKFLVLELSQYISGVQIAISSKHIVNGFTDSKCY